MPSRRIRGLIALNALLIGVLALVTLAPGVSAQPQARARPKGQYTVLDGKYQGAAEAALYVFDASNQELLALRWDRSRGTLGTIGYRDVAADAEQRQRGGR